MNRITIHVSREPSPSRSNDLQVITLPPSSRNNQRPRPLVSFTPAELQSIRNDSVVTLQSPQEIPSNDALPPPTYDSVFKSPSKSRRKLFMAILKLFLFLEITSLIVMVFLTCVPVDPTYAIPSIGALIPLAYVIISGIGRYALYKRDKKAHWMILYALLSSGKWISDALAVLEPIWNVSIGKTSTLILPESWNMPVYLQLSTLPVLGIRQFYAIMFPCSELWNLDTTSKGNGAHQPIEFFKTCPPDSAFPPLALLLFMVLNGKISCFLI